jgi:leucyl/phenylalanyl-tRNA--protein transferase
MLHLTPNDVLAAYRHGVFPMADPDTGRIGWYLPDPRAIIPLDGFHTSRSLGRLMRKGGFAVTFDQDFEAVMRACAARPETWISEDFIEVYGELHRQGFAHSVEVWDGMTLAGGLYGVAIGAAFVAESMFYSRSNASKVALRALVTRLLASRFQLLDVQYRTPHLASLGAVSIRAAEYQRRLDRALVEHPIF